MKLNNSDKELLLDCGYSEENFAQIEEATLKTTYELIGSGKKISTKKALELLGRETYLSGISRSAFHWSAVSETIDGDEIILFDSSKLFK